MSNINCDSRNFASFPINYDNSRVFEDMDERNKNTQKSAEQAVHKIKRELEAIFTKELTAGEEAEKEIDIEDEVNRCVYIITSLKEEVYAAKGNACLAGKLEQKVSQLVKEKQDRESLLLLYSNNKYPQK